MTWMDTSSDLIFDIIIPCFLIQNLHLVLRQFKALYAFSILLILLFKLLECDMIGDFNGTVSSMN